MGRRHIIQHPKGQKVSKSMEKNLAGIEEEEILYEIRNNHVESNS